MQELTQWNILALQASNNCSVFLDMYTLRSEIEVAVAAASSLALPVYWLMTAPDSMGKPNPLTLNEVGVLLLIHVCYLSVPFIALFLRERPFIRAVPIWLWVSVLGAVLLTLADYSIGITYRIERAERVVKEVLVLSVYTLPVTAGVFYFRTLVKAARRWYENDGRSLSILPK